MGLRERGSDPAEPELVLAKARTGGVFRRAFRRAMRRVNAANAVAWIVGCGY